MSIILESEARTRAQREITAYKSSTTILNEHMQKQASILQPDVFLSHAYADRDLILGVALLIEDIGYSVYIDWRDDPQLDRTEVTATTAATLRMRMQSSRCLFYSTTQNSSSSKWMPWELGFKDGHNTRVAIQPILTRATDQYSGQEYLGIYPYVSRACNTAGVMKLWIHKTADSYVEFDSWLKGSNPK